MQPFENAAAKRGSMWQLNAATLKIFTPATISSFRKASVVQYGSATTGHMVLPTTTIMVPTVSLLTIGPPYGFPRRWSQSNNPNRDAPVTQRGCGSRANGRRPGSDTGGDIGDFVGLVHCFRQGFRLETNSLNSFTVL